MEKHVKFDKKADALYIYLDDKPVDHTEKLDDTRYIDYSSDDTPVGIELLCVSDGVITTDLPFRAEIERLLVKNNIKIPA